MPETAARRAWSAKNTTQISVKLNNHTDADILDFLEGKQKQTEIKRLVRMGMEADGHAEEKAQDAP